MSGTRYVDGVDLKGMTALRPALAARAIALQWAVIALAAGLAVWTRNGWVIAAAIVVIATRQHALAVLMHDGSHRLLLRDRRWNDVVSNLFLSFPILVSTARYRAHHLAHHRYLNTERDPDLVENVAPRGARAWALTLLADLTAINFFRSLRSLTSFGVSGLFAGAARTDPQYAGERRLFAGFALAVALALTAAHGLAWFALLWLLPLITVLSAILHVRAIAEHTACENEHPLNTARTVQANVLERALIAPCGIHYHVEHHLYPGVPFYRLGELHRTLGRRAAALGHRAHVTRGYLGRASLYAELSAHSPDQKETAASHAVHD